MLPQQLQVKCVFVHIRVCVFVCCWPTICKATLLRAIISYKNKRVSYNNGTSKAHEQQIETRAWTWALITLLSAHNRKHKHTHAHTHWQMSRVAAAVIINCKFDKQLQQQQQAAAGSSCKSDNMLHGQRLCMTKANSENCYWKVQFFLSHRAVNYACIVLIHRLNRAHTNTNTHTHKHAHCVSLLRVCMCAKKKEAKRGVSASCIGLLLWLYALFHTHTRAHSYN